MPTGEIEPRQVARLKEMGQWLEKYGASIYGTRGGPWRPGNWGVSTRKGDVVYVHVLNWGDKAVKLPAMPKMIVSSRLMSGGKVVVKQSEDAVEIEVAEGDRQPIDTIVELKLEESAMDITPISGPASLTKGKTATASNVFQNTPEYAAGKAVDGDSDTRWATDAGTSAAWLEVDLGKVVAFNRVVIDEALEQRVQEFDLQYKDGEAWKTILKGTTIGANWEREFEPVTARVVRLNILKATEGPTIWEFAVYPAKK
jgi:alpha-L-fucosidase